MRTPGWSGVLPLVVLAGLCGPGQASPGFPSWEPGQPMPACSVLILTVTGGWGTAPLDKEFSLVPVVTGVCSLLRETGMTYSVAQFRRTPADDRCRIAAAAEVLGLLHPTSHRLAQELNACCRREPHPRLILIGLSNGAAFVNEVIGALDPGVAPGVLGIELGTPFWIYRRELSNSLHCDNSGQDPLAAGQIDILAPVVAQGLFSFVCSQVADEEFRPEPVFHFPNHAYTWSRVRPETEEFVSRRFGLRVSRPDNDDTRSGLENEVEVLHPGLRRNEPPWEFLRRRLERESDRPQ